MVHVEKKRLLCWWPLSLIEWTHRGMWVFPLPCFLVFTFSCAIPPFFTYNRILHWCLLFLLLLGNGSFSKWDTQFPYMNWCSKCLTLTWKIVYEPNGSRWKVCPSVLSVYYDTFLYHVLYCIFKLECIHTSLYFFVECKYFIIDPFIEMFISTK